jgi:hypothetical protein
MAGRCRRRTPRRAPAPRRHTRAHRAVVRAGDRWIARSSSATGDPPSLPVVPVPPPASSGSAARVPPVAAGVGGESGRSRGRPRPRGAAGRARVPPEAMMVSSHRMSRPRPPLGCAVRLVAILPRPGDLGEGRGRHRQRDGPEGARAMGGTPLPSERRPGRSRDGASPRGEPGINAGARCRGLAPRRVSRRRTRNSSSARSAST